MRSRRAVAALAAISALIASSGLVQLAGCGSVYGEEAPLPDAGEASSDGALADMRQADAEAGPPFCSGHPTARFCADFDESAGPGFSVLVGDVTLDSTSSLSPPRSARVSATGTAAHLEESLFGAGFAVAQRISFDIKVDVAPSTSMIFWQLDEGPKGCSFQLGARGTAAALYTSMPGGEAGQLDFTSVLATGPLAGEWSHVSVVLTSTAKEEVSIVVKIGNITALDQTTRCTSLSTNVTMQVGLSTEVGSTGTAHYDNVLIEEN